MEDAILLQHGTNENDNGCEINTLRIEYDNRNIYRIEPAKLNSCPARPACPVAPVDGTGLNFYPACPVAQEDGTG
jgi:hypothetical protein